MSDASGTFSVTLVSSDRPVWSGEVSSAMIPAESGSMGILLNHEPILTLIEKGRIRLSPVEGGELSFVIGNGFAAFDSNKLTIAVERCSADDEAALKATADAAAGASTAES